MCNNCIQIILSHLRTITTDHRQGHHTTLNRLRVISSIEQRKCSLNTIFSLSRSSNIDTINSSDFTNYISLHFSSSSNFKFYYEIWSVEKAGSDGRAQDCQSWSRGFMTRSRASFYVTILMEIFSFKVVRLPFLNNRSCETFDKWLRGNR